MPTNTNGGERGGAAAVKAWARAMARRRPIGRSSSSARPTTSRPRVHHRGWVSTASFQLELLKVKLVTMLSTTPAKATKIWSGFLIAVAYGMGLTLDD